MAEETTQTKSVYQFILEEEATYKTLQVPITSSKEWNMHEHIERCTNVANAWFHKGKNDGNRPYDDLVTPILQLARRSEGFDVKDIVLYVNDADKYHKSFLAKKYHPQWARKNEIDTFIDELVESSVVYDLALVKNVNNVRPEVVPLQSIAFCDQTNVLSGPLCLKHQYSPAEMKEFKGKWYDAEIESAIAMAKSSKTVASASDKEVKTPGKYIEVYELHGMFPNHWLDSYEGNADDYSPQMHIVTYYTSEDGKKAGICLYKGKEPKSIFKSLVLQPVFGRACGRSIVESLFEPQAWNNVDSIRIKEMLDAAAVVLFSTDDDDLGNTKLSNLKNNTVVKLGKGNYLNRTDTTAPNITAFNNHKEGLERRARMIGSASEGALGMNPSSGTPFKLEDLIVQQGQGIHEYRQGKIATFVSEQIYRDWVLQYLVNEMNGGKKFSEELSLEELMDIADQITTNEIERKIKRMILATGKVPTQEEREIMRTKFREDFVKKGNRRFFEIMKEEFKDIPIDVYVNIAGKQKNLAKSADKLTNLIMAVIKNPGAFSQIPGVGKLFNELVEESGFSPIDFREITKPTEKPAAPVASAEQTLEKVTE